MTGTRLYYSLFCLYNMQVLNQVGWCVPERVTKRHLYIIEDMYLYIVKTRDSRAVHIA